MEAFLGLRQNAGYNIVKCRTCGLVTIYPHPSQEVLDEFYKNYGSKKGRLHDERFRAENIYPGKLDQLKKLTGGRRLLDIGAGMGTFAALARQSGFDVTGIELSSEQCRIAMEQYGIELKQCNLFTTHDQLGQFDVVHLHHVMEHLASPDRMLEIIYKLLAPDGVALIEVPYQLPRIKDRLGIGTHPKCSVPFNFDHLYYFTPRTMKEYIESHHFLIEKASQFPASMNNARNGLPWSLPKSLYRWITTKTWIPSGRIIEIYFRKLKADEDQ